MCASSGSSSSRRTPSVGCDLEGLVDRDERLVARDAFEPQLDRCALGRAGVHDDEDRPAGVRACARADERRAFAPDLDRDPRRKEHRPRLLDQVERRPHGRRCGRVEPSREDAEPVGAARDRKQHLRAQRLGRDGGIGPPGALHLGRLDPLQRRLAVSEVDQRGSARRGSARASPGCRDSAGDRSRRRGRPPSARSPRNSRDAATGTRPSPARSAGSA